MNKNHINKTKQTKRTNERASLRDLQEFQIKLVVEMKRLGASGTSDPLVMARTNTLNSIKNDIDDVCALISNLDDVVTISSAVWAISAALGKRTNLLLASPHWTMFNLSYIPFFSSVKCFCANDNLSISDVLPQVKEHLLPS
jgi:hypothetical protein